MSFTYRMLYFLFSLCLDFSELFLAINQIFPNSIYCISFTSLLDYGEFTFCCFLSFFFVIFLPYLALFILVHNLGEATRTRPSYLARAGAESLVFCACCIGGDLHPLFFPHSISFVQSHVCCWL
ncbi:hypothetical protein AMTRI_Chr07g23460 [Amborella trichopoda]